MITWRRFGRLLFILEAALRPAFDFLVDFDSSETGISVSSYNSKFSSFTAFSGL